MINNKGSDNVSRLGDTTLTKVFVGGLAWETPKEAMYEHFEKYGDIFEAVVITDKVSGRSKGYGFVTFKEPEAAKKACENATPTINGRRTNCNLAALGACQPSRSSSTTPPLRQTAGSNGGGNATREPTSGTAPAAHVQWYYPTAAPQHAATPSFHSHHQYVPFYPAGYTTPATYITGHNHVNYNNKVSYNSGGAYMNGQYAAQMMYPAGGQMPMYPFYAYAQHQQAHQAAMGLPAHFFQSGPIISSPPIISKPTTTAICIAAPPLSVCLSVE